MSWCKWGGIVSFDSAEMILGELVALKIVALSIYTSSAVITQQVFLSSSHLPLRVCLQKTGQVSSKESVGFTEIP